MQLDTRCLHLLKLLAASEQPLSAVAMAGQLHVSSRMVRLSLANSERWLREHNIELKKVPGKGYSLSPTHQARQNLLKYLHEYEKPLPWLSATERKQILLLNLFFSKNPLQIKQLQQAVNLSRTTVLRLLDSIEQWLKEYDLSLVRRPNFGLMISGNELNWRQAVQTLLQESAGDVQLLALFAGADIVVDPLHRANPLIEETLRKIWIQMDLKFVKQIIHPVEHFFEEAKSDPAYIDFYLQLALAIHRNRLGKQLGTITDSSIQHLSSLRLVESRKIGGRVMKLTAVRLSDAEINWLALQFPDASPRSVDHPPRGDMQSSEDETTLQKTIEEFLERASTSLHPSLPVDRELIGNLGRLLEKMRAVGQGKKAGRNALLSEVQARYPYFYSVASKGRHILSEWIGRELSEDEIGDIAICLIASMERMRFLDKISKRILVVSSAGVVTAWLLVSRLRAEFPDVMVVDVVSALELENRRNFDGIDYIVSTIPVKIRDIPSRQVDPLLGKEDVRRIKDLFEATRNIHDENNLDQSKEIHLSDLITPETIQLRIEAESWQGVVENAGAHLLKTGAIENQFVNAMKHTIQEYGPYMVMWPGTVLLHAPPQGVRRLCMALVTLNKPVHFGHPKNDPVQLAIVLGAVDNRRHITALLELNELMQDKKAVNAIKSTYHRSVILHWIRIYSNSKEMSQQAVTK